MSEKRIEAGEGEKAETDAISVFLQNMQKTVTKLEEENQRLVGLLQTEREQYMEQLKVAKILCELLIFHMSVLHRLI